MRFGPRSCRFSGFHSMWTVQMHGGATWSIYFTGEVSPRRKALHFPQAKWFLLPLCDYGGYSAGAWTNIFPAVTNVRLEKAGGSGRWARGSLFEAPCLSFSIFRSGALKAGALMRTKAMLTPQALALKSDPLLISDYFGWLFMSLVGCNP